MAKQRPPKGFRERVIITGVPRHDDDPDNPGVRRMLIPIKQQKADRMPALGKTVSQLIYKHGYMVEAFMHQALIEYANNVVENADQLRADASAKKAGKASIAPSIDAWIDAARIVTDAFRPAAPKRGRKRG